VAQCVHDDRAVGRHADIFELGPAARGLKQLSETMRCEHTELLAPAQPPLACVRSAHRAWCHLRPHFPGRRAAHGCIEKRERTAWFRVRVGGIAAMKHASSSIVMRTQVLGSEMHESRSAMAAWPDWPRGSPALRIRPWTTPTTAAAPAPLRLRRAAAASATKRSGRRARRRHRSRRRERCQMTRLNWDPAARSCGVQASWSVRVAKQRDAVA